MKKLNKYLIIILIIISFSCYNNSNRVILVDYQKEYNYKVEQYKLKGLDTIDLYKSYQIKINENNRIDSILKSINNND